MTFHFPKTKTLRSHYTLSRCQNVKHYEGFCDRNLRNTIICEYALSTKQWNVCKWVSIPYSTNAGVICTKDGRFLMILGGKRHKRASNQIFVCDFKQRKCVESAYKCPSRGGCRAVAMRNAKRDELLTFGFVHQSFQESEFRNMQIMPKYLIQMIPRWVYKERIYLVRTSGKQKKFLCILETDDILQSVVQL